MIYIEERKAKKVPGITTLFVDMNGNTIAKDILIQMKSAYHYKDTEIWEVPINKLAYLITMCIKFDKINLKLFKEEQKYIKIPNDYEFKTNPFKHQLEGVEYGLNHDNWLLLDEMGLGKSAQIIYLAEILYKQGLLEHCLIICGVNSLKYNWLEEVKKHSNLAGMILGTRKKKKGKEYIGNMQDRIADLCKPIEPFFIITNIETLRDNKIIAALRKKINNIDMVVVDEAHKAKSPTSLQGRNLLKIDWPKRKIALTGTLLLNTPLDAYTALKWTGNEKATFTAFKEQYCEYGGFKNYQIIGFKNLDILHEQINTTSLRRKKEEVLDLPPKTYKIEYVEMNDAQTKFYEQIKQGVLDEIDLVNINPNYAMSLSARLRQATAWTGILSTSVLESAKLDRLEDILDEIICQGNKAVVFSNFKPTLLELEQRLNKNGINNVRCDGDTPESIIEERKHYFQTNDKCKVLIGTWQKMGTGYTLTAANYLIFIDTPFTDGLFQQAADRVHRIGANKNVTIITLITKDTVDERVQDIIEHKAELSDFVVDGIVRPDGAYDFINFLLS